ncbi:MAG: cyclodeaminase/cyclohydrolase family protein, partial [Cyanobacteria bacterium REEB65]|nr:cyclodeaminase/cyclohydrolase family protein [Cyanobacteria bacterium REEB65]
TIRKGEFEGLEAKLADPAWQPDFGPAHPHPTAGASAIGARPFLIAYNLQLDTSDVTVAKEVARAVRASSGGLQNVQAMGVSLDERQCAQVSMNLLNFEKTPLYRVQELVKAEARRFGAAVTDAEIVGLIPQAALDQAASDYLQVGNWSPALVLEERIRQEQDKHLTDLRLPEFLARVASAEPVPGGGCAAALAGSLGAALVAMVGALTLKPAFAAVHEQAAALGSQGEALQSDLLGGVAADAAAFAAVMGAMALPKGTEEEKASRKAAIAEATKDAAEVPLAAAQKALAVAQQSLEALAIGNPNAASDAGVAGLLALAGLEGSLLNVAINLGSLPDEAWVSVRRERAGQLLEEARSLRDQLWSRLGDKIPELRKLGAVGV